MHCAWPGDMVIKSKILITCNTKEFDCWNFQKDWFSNSNIECFFLVGDYHIWSLTNVQRKPVGFEPVINTYQFPIHSGMNIVNVSVGCKNCCTVSKMNKTDVVWGFMHVIDIQKKKYWSDTEPCETPNVMLALTGVFDCDILFPVTQIRFKPALHDISNAIMQEITHQYICHD